MSFAIELPDDVALSDDEAKVVSEPLPDHFEVVDGQIVETPYMSAYAGRVASRLKRAVDRYLQEHDIGETDIEVLYHIPQPEDEGRNRRPDWSYVSYERWPKDRPIPYRGNAYQAVPDIAAEVVSPGDHANELHEKVRDYLRGGVRLVWVVYPLSREIHAFVPGSNQIRVYFAADDLDAGEILPGFRTPLAPLFPPVEAPPPAPPE